MSGLELFKAMRVDPKLARLPFLMITAEAERQRIEEVIAAGVSSLLVKPYTVASLKARLERLVADLPRPPATTAPVRPVASAVSAAGAERGGEVALLSPRILIVDDVPASLQGLAQLFKADYQVQTALDGPTALALCRVVPLPDLLLLDVVMPGMDGLEVARRIRAQPATAQMPVIFVTDVIDEAARAQGMALGAVDYVAKSTDPATLRTRVGNFIRFIEQRRQLQADYDALLEAARRREDAEHTSRHDIKGSLAGIVGMVQSLAEDDSMAPRHVTQLRLVEQTALQVMGMVNLASELYKIESGSFNLKAVPVEVGPLLHRIVELSRSSFHDKGLAIAVDTDTPVGTEMPKAVGDAMLCYSLFQNLIKNACEAAPPGTRVTVTLKDETPLRVLIHNTGAVPPELRERFFEKFATSGKDDGSGLGTYSARTMARAQNGSVSMQTADEDNSTTLTVILPRHAFAPAQMAS